MNIGWAVEALKEGKMVTRPGWNGKGMYLILDVHPDISKNFEPLPVQETFFMRTAQDNFVAWLCSQSDLLATDWYELQ